MRFHLEGDVLVGMVQCSQVYGGAVDRVHGGVIAGLFDAIIATRGAFAGAGITVNLIMNFRHPAPLDSSLRMEAVVEKFEGRKCYVSARLLAGGVLIADAKGLLLAHKS
jgi:acyl-coenzyme A thioesterase PaaI-like protein